MKKLFALALSALLAASLCLVASAGPFRDQTPPASDARASDRRVYQIETAGYLADEDGVVILDADDGEGDRSVDTVAPGDTVYYKLKTQGNLPVTAEAAVAGVTFTQDWSVGNGLIDRIEIVQKKFIDGRETDYCYMLAITTKQGASQAAIQDAMGTVTLKKSSGTDPSAPSTANSLAFTLSIRFFFEVGYEEATFSEITETPRVYLTGGAREVMTFTFEESAGSSLDLDVAGADRILLGADDAYSSAIQNRYPNAVLTFFNGTSSNFNRTATLRLYAPNGGYLYEVGASGNLTASSAPYSSADAAFIIETRALGRYVISDVPLSLSGAVSSSSAASSSQPVLPDVPQSSGTVPPALPTPSVTTPSDPGKTNPGTGAAA